MSIYYDLCWTHVFWCMFLESHLTSYYSNPNVWLSQVTELDMPISCKTRCMKRPTCWLLLLPLCSFHPMMLCVCCRLWSCQLHKWNISYTCVQCNVRCKSLAPRLLPSAREREKMLTLVGSTWLKCPFDPLLILSPLDLISVLQDY